MNADEAKKILLLRFNDLPKDVQMAVKFTLENWYKLESISDTDGLPNEEWRDVVGYEGLYQVSNFGRIRSHKQFDKWLVRKNTFERSRQYEAIYLSDAEGNRKHYYVHFLVARAFIPNLQNKPFVNHKNGNKRDNRVDNLEWATHSENIQHAHLNDLFISSKLKKADRELIKNMYKPYDREFGAAALAKRFGVSEKTIRNLVNDVTYNYQ